MKKVILTPMFYRYNRQWKEEPELLPEIEFDSLKAANDFLRQPQKISMSVIHPWGDSGPDLIRPALTIHPEWDECMCKSNNFVTTTLMDSNDEQPYVGMFCDQVEITYRIRMVDSEAPLTVPQNEEVNSSIDDLLHAVDNGVCLSDAQETRLWVLLNAAMFKQLGRLTKISRSGQSIIFSDATARRQDLCGDYADAIRQIRQAGIPLDVSELDVISYQRWWLPIYDSRRVGDAKFLITAPYTVERGKEKAMVNSVRLIDGWGVRIASATFDRKQQWKNGLFHSVQSVKKIERFIEDIREKMPEYANARIQDNDLTPRN